MSTLTELRVRVQVTRDTVCGLAPSYADVLDVDDVMDSLARIETKIEQAEDALASRRRHVMGREE